MTQVTQESQAERKVQRELFAGAVEVSRNFDHVLEKCGLHKALRVCAWVSRFTHNSRHPSEKTVGPLSTQEIATRELFWIKIQGPRRVFWSGGGGGGGELNRSLKGESSSVMPGVRSPGKIWKFKSSEMAGNGSCKQIYIDKKLLKWLVQMHPVGSLTLTKDPSKIRKN